MAESWLTLLADFISPNFFAGFMSGFPTALVCAPFDTITVRMQVETFCEVKLKSHSLYGLVRNTLKEEGLSGLFVGFNVTSVVMPAHLSIYFASYEKIKNELKTWGEVQANAMAAILAGGVSNIFTCPLWVVRTRMMTQRLHKSNKYSGITQSMRLMVREEGWTSLYQGFFVSQLRLIHVGIQLPVYEWMKKNIAGQNSPTFIQMLYLTAVPKLLANAVSYPLEVLRSRQADSNKSHGPKFNNLRELVALTWKLEGFHGFYVGFWVTTVRVLPATYATLWTYEQVLHLLREFNGRA